MARSEKARGCEVLGCIAAITRNERMMGFGEERGDLCVGTCKKA